MQFVDNVNMTPILIKLDNTETNIESPYVLNVIELQSYTMVSAEKNYLPFTSQEPIQLSTFVQRWILDTNIKVAPTLEIG